jgi:bifunctional DNase/RNase
LLLAGLTACCMREQTAAAIPSDQVKVDVRTVGFDRESGAHVVVLQDPNQQRELPILIGDNEAQAIMLELHGIKPPRPLTHDLLRDMLKQTGNHIDRILISDLRDEVYYAKIYLDHGKYAIDSRPSDAIALAMGTNAPIYVSNKLFATAPATAVPPAAQEPEVARAAGITVQPLTSSLAHYFGVPEGRGVLVAEADEQAQAAGIARGDIIVKVGDRELKAVNDFNLDVAASGARKPLTLTVRRDGSEHTVTLAPEAGR